MNCSVNELRRFLLAIASIVLLGTAACANNAQSISAPTSSPSTEPELLNSADFPTGYQVHPGSTAQELAQQQRQMVASRAYTPTECKEIFAAQAERTAGSQRRGIYVEHDQPYKPAFGDFVIRGGETIEQSRDVSRRCGDFTATVEGEGEVSMTTEERVAPSDLAVETFVVKTVVTTKPLPGNPNSVPAQQKSLIGHAQLSDDKRVTFFEEVYGFDTDLDAALFDRLFDEAVERAATTD